MRWFRNTAISLRAPPPWRRRRRGRRLICFVRRPHNGLIATAAAPAMQSAQEVIETYIRAKDENRPYLMERAFAANATLEMIVNSGTISFPPITQGLQSISDVLVRRFAQTYRNVQTFCLAPPPRHDDVRFSCNWLVGMSEKGSCMVRVGCGRYDWLFPGEGPRLVERLTITIHRMESLAPTSLTSVMNWLCQLPHPWCPAQIAMRDAPALDELQSIREFIGRDSI